MIASRICGLSIQFGNLLAGDVPHRFFLVEFTPKQLVGIGLSWSIVRRKLSGQADVDDIDE